MIMILQNHCLGKKNSFKTFCKFILTLHTPVVTIKYYFKLDNTNYVRVSCTMFLNILCGINKFIV